MTHEPKLSLEQVEEAATTLEGKSIDEILGWAFATFGDRLGFMTALGYSGLILMDFVRRHRPDMEIFTIDTGHLFPETIELRERLAREWGIRFTILRPLMTMEQLEQIVGPNPWSVNPDLCCHYMKVEPLLRVIHTRDAWLSAVRRDQSSTRADSDVVEMDGRGVIKIQPMVSWTFEQAWDYIRSHKVPYSPLHDRGYPSVGCVHCTSPVKPGEHERSGRWNSQPKLECGIHTPKQSSRRR
jgi:phosphoadenosine phosphosulfate reductase